MPRGAHLSRELTEAARLAGRLRDPRSFISPEGKVYLAGKDIRRARARVFGRDEGLCVDCGEEVQFEPYGFGAMELSHKKPRSLGGDDSDDNLATRCIPCHRRRDGHGQPMHF